MRFDERGQYVPDFNVEELAIDSVSRILEVCPFSDRAEHEDALAQGLYQGMSYEENLGYYRGIYAGYSTDSEVRASGSSGGVATWVLATMVRSGVVDGVIHVQACDESSNGALFKYAISRSVEDVLKAGKSKYYPIELSEVAALVKREPGRYAFVGVPCFVKAMRRYARINPSIRESIRFYIGLVCGHLKSKAFAEALAWSNGVHPSDLQGFQFRTKLEGEKASNYGVTIRSKVGEQVRPVRPFIGGNWGLGFFKYNACEYCDDIFAETADIVIGDAWLPKYIRDEGGTSLVLVRSQYFADLIYDGITAGDLKLDELSEAQAIQTQAAGIRHRRSGLKYRLHLKRKRGEWVPTKRCASDATHIGLLEKLLQRVRLATVVASHRAWVRAKKQSSWDIFVKKMKPWLLLNRGVLSARKRFGSVK
jgi:coenzyme F420-reducing hydrogenase beta subunit